MREINVQIVIGGKNKIAKTMLKQYKSDGFMGGYCDYKVNRSGLEKAEVWINSRQTGREMIDSFFHEMTHLYFRLAGKTKNEQEEATCRWVGYLAKIQISDSLGKCRKCGEKIKS